VPIATYVFDLLSVGVANDPVEPSKNAASPTIVEPVVVVELNVIEMVAAPATETDFD
jgi:hypothetical protein